MTKLEALKSLLLGGLGGYFGCYLFRYIDDWLDKRGPSYDFSKGVRGKYAKREQTKKDTNWLPK